MADEKGNSAPPGNRSSPSLVVLVNLESPDGAKTEGFTARTLLDMRDGHQLKVTTPSTAAKTDAQVISSIAQIIRAQVKEHGTLGELRFNGEGSPRYVYHGKDAIPLNIGDLLTMLRNVQKELGTQVADKISFMACNTFTELSPQDVALLRKRSTELGSELVGTTDYIAKTPIPGLENIKLISFMHGQVGHYTPSTVSLGTELLLKTRALISDDAKYSNRWMACHINEGQETGAACQQRFEVKNSSAAEPPSPTPGAPEGNPKPSRNH